MEKAYKYLKILLLVLCFVALLLGAKRLYDTLGSQVQMDALVTQPETVAPDATEAGKQEAPDFTVYDIDGNAHLHRCFCIPCCPQNCTEYHRRGSG